MLVNGQRNAGPDLVEKFIRHLKLDQAETEHFRRLAQRRDHSEILKITLRRHSFEGQDPKNEFIFESRAQITQGSKWSILVLREFIAILGDEFHGSFLESLPQHLKDDLEMALVFYCEQGLLRQGPPPKSYIVEKKFYTFNFNDFLNSPDLEEGFVLDVIRSLVWAAFSQNSKTIGFQSSFLKIREDRLQDLSQRLKEIQAELHHEFNQAQGNSVIALNLQAYLLETIRNS